MASDAIPASSDSKTGSVRPFSSYLSLTCVATWRAKSPTVQLKSFAPFFWVGGGRVCVWYMSWGFRVGRGRFHSASNFQMTTTSDPDIISGKGKSSVLAVGGKTVKGKLLHINQSQPQALPNNQMKHYRPLFNQQNPSGAVPDISD